MIFLLQFLHFSFQQVFCFLHSSLDFMLIPLYFVFCSSSFYFTFSSWFNFYLNLFTNLLHLHSVLFLICLFVSYQFFFHIVKNFLIFKKLSLNWPLSIFLDCSYIYFILFRFYFSHTCHFNVSILFGIFFDFLQYELTLLIRFSFLGFPFSLNFSRGFPFSLNFSRLRFTFHKNLMTVKNFV